MTHDTEDVCGAETVGDGRCQNPTVEEGDPERCWIPSHNDPDAENPHGRDWSITPEDHDDLKEAASEGLSKSGCARAVGVSHTELNRYLDAHPDFRSDFARAREQGERTLIKRGLYDPETDSSMAKFILSTSFGYVKTEKREIENTGDTPMTEIVVDFEDADT